MGSFEDFKRGRLLKSIKKDYRNYRKVKDRNDWEFIYAALGNNYQAFSLIDKDKMCPEVILFMEQHYMPCCNVIREISPYCYEGCDFSDSFKLKSVNIDIDSILYMNNPPKEAWDVVRKKIVSDSEEVRDLVDSDRFSDLPDDVMFLVLERSLYYYRFIKNPSEKVTEKYQELLKQRNKTKNNGVSKTQKGSNKGDSANKKDLTDKQVEFCKDVLKDVIKYLCDKYLYGMTDLYDDNGKICLRQYSNYITIYPDGHITSRIRRRDRLLVPSYGEEKVVGMLRTAVEKIETMPFGVKKITFNCSLNELTHGYIEDSTIEKGSKNITLF